MQLASDPYYGNPLVVTILDKRLLSNSGAYVALCREGNESPARRRLTYEWVRGKTQIKFPATSTMAHLVQTSGEGVAPAVAKFELVAYIDGGWIADGKVLLQFFIGLKNPVENFVVVRHEQRNCLELRLTCHCPLPNGVATVTVDNVRMMTIALQGTQTAFVPAPRVNTALSVSVCPSLTQGQFRLAERTVLIQDPANKYHALAALIPPTLHSTTATFDVTVQPLSKSNRQLDELSFDGAVVSSPADSIVFRVTSEKFSLEKGDEIVIVPMANAERPFPTTNLLQFARTQRRQRRLIVSEACCGCEVAGIREGISYPGLYAVSLGLQYGQGMLVADCALVFVTTKKTELRSVSQHSNGPACAPAPMPPFVDYEAPAAAAPQAFSQTLPSTVTDETFLCRIWMDRPVTILMRPCNHLCFCERCAEDDRLTKSCPMCRGAVKSKEKIFLA